MKAATKDCEVNSKEKLIINHHDEGLKVFNDEG